MDSSKGHGKGKKIGIIGFGNNGSLFSSLLKPFGNKILFFDEKFSSAEIDKFNDKNLKQASISSAFNIGHRQHSHTFELRRQKYDQ